MEHKVTIITNNVPRNLLYWYELTAKEQAEFDYLDTDSKQQDANFVRYKGATYHLEDTEYVDTSHNFADHPFKAWHSKVSDSFFSGVLFRYADRDYATVICGRYYS